MSDEPDPNPPPPPPHDPTNDPPAVTERPLSDDAWARIWGGWIDGHIRMSPVSASQVAWEHLNSVGHHLRELIEKEIGGSS